MRTSIPVLTEIQRNTLAVILDLIVPPSDDGRMPGAAEFDVWGYVCAAAPRLCEGIREDLDEIARRAERRRGRALVDATEIGVLVEELRAADPTFLATLAAQTVSCYYQQDRVMVALGLEARAPYPEGFVVRTGDLSLLDPVRRRGPIFRDVQGK